MAGTTASRNRYGQYERSRSSPVQPRTPSQTATRAHIAAVAAAWRSVTDAQRAGWSALGAQITRTDSLGQTHSFNGYSCFCSVNSERLNAGDAQIVDAPELVTPVALSTLVPTAAAGAATHTLAYTVTPAPANTKLVIEASPQMSAGKKFNRRFTIVLVTAAAAASPANIAAAYLAKYGALVAGSRIFYRVRQYIGGFVSGEIVASVIVAA